MHRMHRRKEDILTHISNSLSLPLELSPLRHEDEVFKEAIDLGRRLQQAGHHCGVESVNKPFQVVHHAVQCGAVQTRADLIQEESVTAG